MTPEKGTLAKLLGGENVLSVEKLHGDGSARTYWRVVTGSCTHMLLVGPDKAENAAWVRVARHLASVGVRVPEVRRVAEDLGWVLMEDLGDINLQAFVKAGANQAECYAEVIPLLLRMQVRGADGFVLATGFAKAPYGPETMVEEEGMYFLREFAGFVLGLDFDPSPLRREFREMAELAAKAPSGYFLHRDFQSRNIHRTGGGWAIIDFQGARPGPLAYDAAALILDPYVALPRSVRDSLFSLYLRQAAGEFGVDAEAVRRSWPLIGSFRLMQVLGAFGKLGGRLGKPGFLPHSGAALRHLGELLDDPLCAQFSGIREMVARCTLSWSAKT